MNSEAVLNDTIEIIREVLIDLEADFEIKGEALLANDLGMESISLISVVFKCEEHFSIELQEKLMEEADIFTVKDLVELIESCEPTLAA